MDATVTSIHCGEESLPIFEAFAPGIAAALEGLVGELGVRIKEVTSVVQPEESFFFSFGCSDHYRDRGSPR
jgi:hypothetical protein